MDVPSEVYIEVLKLITQKTGTSTTVKKFTFVGGGCINSGGKLETSAGNFFLKWNDVISFPGMFKAEQKGLALLAGSNTLHIPIVYGYGEMSEFQFLLLEYIESKPPSSTYWNALGIDLANLHKSSSTVYGLDHDNYIGSLRQLNNPSPSWIDFFIHHRLLTQLELAIKHNRIDPILAGKFETLYKKLPSLLEEGRPALLHGDLWSGNLIVDAEGGPCIIDPAVYYGHREVDLAMTQLFGGFNEKFYDAYNEAFPLSPGYQERFDVYNLYPLLVHVNLFGSSYLNPIQRILKTLKI